MKLLGSVTSPYVRKVRVVLAEKKIDHEFVIDTPSAAGSQVTAANPLARIPTLIVDDWSLFDSRVIVEYLDNVTPNNQLIPASGRSRIVAKRWEALADGVNDAAVAARMESVRPAEKQDANWTARNLKVVAQGLDAMESELGSQAWCMGTKFSLADIAVGCALGYLLLRFPDINWQATHPNLARLYAKLMKRASFADTTPQP